MRITEALDAWASQNRDHLSLDTLGEVDIISRRVEGSVLADEPMTHLSPEQLEVVDSLFGLERAERARLLLEVVASWYEDQPPPAQDRPVAPASVTAEPDAAPIAAAAPRPVPPQPATPELASAPVLPSQAMPAPQPVGDADQQALSAPTFLGSDEVDQRDQAQFYGPASRASSTSKTLVAVVASVLAIGAIVVVAMILNLRDANEDSVAISDAATVGDEPVAEPAPTLEQPTSPPVTPPVESETVVEAETQAPEVEATAPIRTAWADTTTVLNSGSADVLASTYNVSPANRAVLIGHTAAITGIAIADDGRVLTSGADKRLVDWGADVTAANPDVLEVDATLTALTRTQDQLLVAGDGLGNVTVIDLVDGGNPQIIGVHPVAVSSVAEVAVRTLAVGSVDGAVAVFSLDDPGAIRTLDHPVEVTGIALLDDARIATSSVDGFVRLWPQDGTEPETISTHDTALTSLTALSSGRYASADVAGNIQVVDPATGGPPLATLIGHNGPVRAMIQIDDTTLVSGGDDSTLRVWDMTTGEQQRVLDGHGDLISALDSLPDGRVVSTSADGTARVWDLTLPAEAPVEPPHALNVSDIAGWANDQLVTGGDDGRVMLVSTSITQTPTLITQHAGPIVGIEVMPNRDIVSLDSLSSLRLSEANGDGSPLFETTIAPGATALAARGSSGVVTGHSDGTVRFTDFTTEVAVVNAHGSGVNDVVALSSGLILSAGQDRTVRVINLDDDTDRLPVFDLHTAPVDVVAELPDGRVASAGSDGIYIWSTSELGRDHVRLDGHRSTITSLFGLPGNRLLSTARDGRVRLWNLDDPEAGAVTLVDVPGVVNPVLTQAGNGLFVTGAGRGYVTFSYEG